MKFVHKIWKDKKQCDLNRQPEDSNYFNKTNEKFIRKFKITNDFVGLSPNSYLLDHDGGVEIFKEARGNKIFCKRVHSA